VRSFAAILAILVAAGQSLVAGDRSAEWKSVDEAVNKGLPKTAIEALERIIPQALAEKRYAEAV